MDYETPDMLVRVQDDVTLVRLKGPSLTGVTDVTRLGGALNSMIDEGTHRLIIDFKNIRHIGSSTLGLLLAIQKRLREIEGGRLVISHPEHIEELLRISQTARLFEIAADSKAAFALLKPAKS
jgi:anti-anti-sigma factor